MTHIEYGDELASLNDTPALLRQICLRLDRHFPNAATTAAEQDAAEAGRVVIKSFMVELTEMGLLEMARKLGKLISDGSDPEGGDL